LPNPFNRAALTAPRADLLALLAGALLPLAFAPLSLFPLAVLSPALLFLLWLDVTPRRALWRGLLFGLGQFGVGVSWVYVAIHDFGHSGVPLAVLLSALFVGVLALFPMLLGYLSARFLRGPDGLRLALLFPAGWTLIEWCRGWVLTGLPWLNLGYSQIDAPLRGFAPITGVYGVTLAVALSAGLLAALLYAGRRARFITLAGLALLWIAGALLTRIDWTEASGPPLRGSGVARDVRKDEPYAAYDEMAFDVPIGASGDTYDRYLVRMEEFRQSLRIIRQATEGIPEGPIVGKVPRLIKPPAGETYHAIESPKGELGYFIVSDGKSTNPYRFRVRPPSFCNLQGLRRLVKGHLVADVVALIGSLDVVLGEVDR